jgi:hypothetical protein
VAGCVIEFAILFGRLREPELGGDVHRRLLFINGIRSPKRPEMED